MSECTTWSTYFHTFDPSLVGNHNLTWFVKTRSFDSFSSFDSFVSFRRFNSFRRFDNFDIFIAVLSTPNSLASLFKKQIEAVYVKLFCQRKELHFFIVKLKLNLYQKKSVTRIYKNDLSMTQFGSPYQWTSRIELDLKQ